MTWPSTRSSLMLVVQGLVLAAGCLVCQHVAIGDDAVRPEQQRAAPAEFRRVFVPADSPEEWPVGAQRFLPLAKAEFSRLIALEQGRAGDDGEPAGVRVKSVRYFADLQQTDQMQISAELDVELLDEQPKAAANQRVESLDSLCRLARVERRASVIGTMAGRKFFDSRGVGGAF